MTARFVRWINAHWTHSRDEDGDFGIRSFLHIFAGLVPPLALLAHPNGWVLSAVFAYWFYKYQRNEDVHTIDQAWKDLNGALIGLVLGVGIVWLARGS